MCVDFVEEYAEAHRGAAPGEPSPRDGGRAADSPPAAGDGDNATTRGKESGGGRNRTAEVKVPATAARGDDGKLTGAAKDTSQNGRDDGTGATRESVKSGTARD